MFLLLVAAVFFSILENSAMVSAYGCCCPDNYIIWAFGGDPNNTNCDNYACYRYINHSMSFDDAEKMCMNDVTNGHLLSIRDAYENLFVDAYTRIGPHPFNPPNGVCWFGLHLATDATNTSHWEFTDGTPVRYTDWGHSQPSTYNCATFNNIYNNDPLCGRGNFCWMNDVYDCNQPLTFICKTPILIC